MDALQRYGWELGTALSTSLGIAERKTGSPKHDALGFTESR